MLICRKKKSKVTIDYAGDNLGNLVNGCQERVKQGLEFAKRVTGFTGQENINRVELFTAVLSS